MLTLLFIIITFTNIKFISGVENDTEFINSLPEKQKKEFLQKVEKRIQKEVPEVKIPEGNDTDVDLYEKRLEDQGKSIQNIMRSEIDNIKADYRRNTNETRSGHIDLTLRSHDENTVRRDSETNKFPKKSILFEDIPVAVQYDSANAEKTPSTLSVEINNKNAQKVKNESKSNVITWENTSGFIDKNDKTNTSAERKRSGRRSDDYDAPLNVTIIQNASSSVVTDAIGVTTSSFPTASRYILNSDGITELVDNTKLNTDGSTLIADISSDVTLGVSLMAENEKKTTTLISDTSSTVTQRVSIQAENEKMTTQGNISKVTDTIDGKPLDYVISTQKNLINSTLNYFTLASIGNTFNTENADGISVGTMDATKSYDNNSHMSDQFSRTLKYVINSQTNSLDISTTQYNLDYSATQEIDTNLDTAINYSIPSNGDNNINTENNTKPEVVVNTALYDNNLQNGNTFSSTTQHTISLKSNNVVVSTTHNNIDNSSIFYNVIITEATENNKAVIITNTTVDTDDSSRISDKSSTTSTIVDTSKYQNIKHAKEIDTVSTKVNREYFSTTKGDSNSTSTTNTSSLPGSIKATAIDKLMSNHQYVTNKDNIIVVIDNEHNISRLDGINVDLRKIHDSTTTDKIGSVTYNVTNTTTLGNVNTNSLYKHYSIIVGSHKLDDIDANLHNDYVFETTEHHQGKMKLGPNSPISVNENSPKYVPVYNYDPENAYFNPNIERPMDEKEKAESDFPAVIKKTETHSKTTSLDIFFNGNKQSLRIKDIKERVTSAAKIKKYSALYDVLLADGSVESSKDEGSYEKPLKHSLAKIREKLYKYKSKSKPNERDERNRSKNDETTVGNINSSVKNKHEEENIAELFRNFGKVLKKIANHYDDSDESFEIKKGSNIYHGSDREIYKDVANSLENHNKNIKNKNIQQIVETLNKIQSNFDQKHKYKNVQSGYQSRFLIKNRDEKHKKNDDDQEAYSSIIKDVNGPFIINEYGDFVEEVKEVKIGDDYLNVHLDMLKDLIDKKDIALEQYDWLGSTVLIQAGLAKLLHTVDQTIRHKKLHPLDRELLELFMKLHKSAISILTEENDGTPTKRKRLSFRIPKPKKGTKNFNALNRMYGEMKKTRAISLIRSRYTVEDFKEFLTCVRSCLNDFHTAIKEISYITTYKKQRWYKNIKQLYLQSAGEKEYLELLLHLVTARLIGLIEEREKNILEGVFDKRDREEDRIAVEVVMTLRICKELMRLNE